MLIKRDCPERKILNFKLSNSIAADTPHVVIIILIIVVRVSVIQVHSPGVRLIRVVL